MTVRRANSLDSWNVLIRPWRASSYTGRPVTSWPAYQTRPAVGRSDPAISLSAVDLPAPFGPIRPVILDSGTLKETPSTARTPTNSTRRSATWSRHGSAGREARSFGSMPGMSGRLGALAVGGDRRGGIADPEPAAALRHEPGRPP